MSFNFNNKMKRLATVPFKKIGYLLVIGYLMTLIIFLPDFIYLFKNGVFNYLLIGLIVVPMLLLVPVVLFFWNLRVYYYILAFITLFTPIALVPVFLINSQTNTEMLGLVMDTNYHEVTELMGWKLYALIFLCLLSPVVFIFLARRLPKKTSFKRAALISLVSLGCFLLLPFTRTTDTAYYSQILKNTFKTYYPFRIADAADYLTRELKNVENYNKAVANFSFGAYRQKKDSARHIHLLLIGETARYDHWSINGYARETSPNLSAEKNLISFSNVASSGTMTMISVPLIVTRADATNFDDHKKERSILTAYKEAGYRSYWISNQSKYGLTGNIGMHYNDGDTAIFNGWGSNENNFNGNTDSALIPMIKGILQSEKNNDVFMAVHMIGSHWRYILRYPENFAKFKPVSDKNRMMMGYPERSVMINEYDNSILFADYIISQIIELVRATGAEATVTYVADHGENLGDNPKAPLYFHGYEPQYYTAKVPLFIWASDSYLKSDMDKFRNLQEHKNRPVSSGSNLFYTLLDMSGIGFRNQDSTRSIASPYFADSPQIIRGSNGKNIRFSELKK